MKLRVNESQDIYLSMKSFMPEEKHLKKLAKESFETTDLNHQGLTDLILSLDIHFRKTKKKWKAKVFANSHKCSEILRQYLPILWIYIWNKKQLFPWVLNLNAVIIYIFILLLNWLHIYFQIECKLSELECYLAKSECRFLKNVEYKCLRIWMQTFLESKYKFEMQIF